MCVYIYILFFFYFHFYQHSIFSPNIVSHIADTQDHMWKVFSMSMESWSFTMLIAYAPHLQIHTQIWAMCKNKSDSIDDRVYRQNSNIMIVPWYLTKETRYRTQQLFTYGKNNNHYHIIIVPFFFDVGCLMLVSFILRLFYWLTLISMN